MKLKEKNKVKIADSNEINVVELFSYLLENTLFCIPIDMKISMKHCFMGN